ncbi:MAG TPA: ATP-binding protein, partial [Candidatus Ozemobacteraceae bacterium]|nr:ATP-binding protein [Candidatus Ozemobacteraceae bacterium]
HFGPPFLLSVDRLLARIRNLTVRAMPSGTLFPQEMSQYDTWVIREALHNCIAHQDYHLRGRITVVETPDSLMFTNVGSFLPGNVEQVIRQDAPPDIYRNPFLAEAMVNLNMIDTQGGGIKRMFRMQIQRFFPLPDYDLTQPERVAVRLTGRIIDEQYTQLLMQRGDITLEQVMLLDRVQKRLPIPREAHQKLKSAGLIEGRYPNSMVSSLVARVTSQKARHIRERGLDKQYYLDMILALVKEHGPVTREDIDQLLSDKLPDILTPQQKAKKVHNLLCELSRKKQIVNKGSRRISQWFMC